MRWLIRGMAARIAAAVQLVAEPRCQDKARTITVGMSSHLNRVTMTIPVLRAGCLSTIRAVGPQQIMNQRVHRDKDSTGQAAYSPSAAANTSHPTPLISLSQDSIQTRRHRYLPT